MTLIRPAIDADAHSICAILNPIIDQTTITFSPSPITPKDVTLGIADHAKRGDPYFVAEREGKVLGFAKYGPFRSGIGYARTAEITVHLSRDARGQGLGRRMVSALEDHARLAGIHSLIAGISAENAPALEFHAKLGFQQVGQIAKAGYKFERFIDLILLQKCV